MKTIGLMATFLCVALSTTGLKTAEKKHMDETQLCQKLEDCYKNIKSVEKEKEEGLDFYVEKLSYLVLAAGSYSSGSEQMDAIFTKIQKEYPTLAVPRFVMTPAELEKFINDMATDDANDHVYLTYRKKLCYMSEWIAQAKQAITQRSGFKFDPSVQVIHAQ